MTDRRSNVSQAYQSDPLQHMLESFTQSLIELLNNFNKIDNNASDFQRQTTHTKHQDRSRLTSNTLQEHGKHEQPFYGIPKTSYGSNFQQPRDLNHSKQTPRPDNSKYMNTDDVSSDDSFSGSDDWDDGESVQYQIERPSIPPATLSGGGFLQRNNPFGASHGAMHTNPGINDNKPTFADMIKQRYAAMNIESKSTNDFPNAGK